MVTDRVAAMGGFRRRRSKLQAFLIVEYRCEGAASSRRRRPENTSPSPSPENGREGGRLGPAPCRR